MVRISRANPRGRRMGGKSSSSIFTFRNLFVFLVVVQCLRMMITNISDGTPPTQVTDVKDRLNQFANTKIDKNKKTDVPDEIDATDDLHEPVMDEESEDTDGNEDEEQSDSADLNPIVIDKKGTGPTTVGYVKDFIHERNNPAYRNLETPVADYSPAIAKLINERSVLPCHDETAGLWNPRCLDDDTQLIAYNSESFTRTWCGQEIKPKSAVVMTEHCTDPISHLFSSEVQPITGEHMPPIIVKSSAEKELQETDIEKVECNIPCQQEKGLKLGGVHSISNDYFIDGETWTITMTKDSGQKIDRTDYMKDQYFSSESLLSSVPLTDFDSTMNSLRNRPMVDFETAEEKAIYLVNEKCSASKRNRWFDAVGKQVPVDSYGNCGHNIEVPEGMTIGTAEGRIALSKRYRIVLAFDDDTTKDHISNLVWEAFVSGAVPVVVGADNLRDRFPPNSFINVNDFNQWDKLGDYVKKVVSDKELWLSYHKWRDDEEIISAFERQNYFSRTTPTCRLCRWAYAKKYGLGWDHTKQEVRAVSKIPKDQFCTTADHGLVSKPFFEQWVTKRSGDDDKKILEEDSEGESCSSLETDGAIAVGSFNGRRKVFQHDGVTDFIITELIDESVDAQTTLRLNFPGVRNPDGACFYNTHSLVSTAKGSKVSSASIQDDLVKITILANWDTSVISSGEGIMEVVVKNDSKSKTDNDGSAPRRVRVIIEEMNIVDKMTEFFPSSYCKLMTKDFIDPIGVFFVDS